MIKKIFIIGIILIGILACSEEFTEHPAIGALSEDALNNEQGVNLLLTGAYATLGGKRINGGEFLAASADNWWIDALSDDAHKGSTDSDQGVLFSLETYDWQTDNKYFLGKWLSLFAGINRANAVITFIGNLEEGDYSSQLTEARFLRGYFNFELQKIWGNVPYISEENYANTEFNQPNPGPIWSQIEADFQYAIDNLPVTQDQVGRPTAWAAKSFLGKVLLQQSKWSDALSLFNDVISNGPYSLIPEFGNNFRIAGDNSSESIFAIQFTADEGKSYNGNNGGAINFPAGGPFGSCCGFYQPTQDLVNAYQTDVNGLPLLDTFNQTDVVNDYGITSAESFTPHTGTLDPRLDFTVGRRGIDYNGYGIHPGRDWIRSNPSDISGHYSPKKNVYYNGEDANQGGPSGWQQFSGINYHLIRYSDLLLMAAEAAVETGDIATALTYVNIVRNRAKDMTYVKNIDGTADAATYKIEPYTSFADQDYARKAVRFERRLELAMEGHRLFDIRRWNNGTDLMRDYFMNESRVITSIASKTKAYEAKHNLMPIPLTAIDLSGGILQQNSGY